MVFGAMVAHLIGEPYDSRSKLSMSSFLYKLEFCALTVCFLTFWGGLLFYLGHDEPGSVPQGALMATSLGIVISNAIFIVYTLFRFALAYIKDRKVKQHRMTLRNLRGKLKSILSC